MSTAARLRSGRAPALDLGRDPALRIRRIEAADVAAALGKGWRDFLAKPSHNLFLALIYPAAGAALVWLASGGAALVLVWPLVSGFALIGPVAAIGLFDLSRRAGGTSSGPSGVPPEARRSGFRSPSSLSSCSGCSRPARSRRRRSGMRRRTCRR